MLKPFDGFVGPAYQSQSIIADGERLINLYPERIEAPKGQVPWALYPAPGVTIVCTVANTIVPIEAPIRGVLSLDHLVTGIASQSFVFVGGPVVYTATVNADGTLTATVTNGRVVVDSNPCQLASNGDVAQQVIVTSGGHGYLMKPFNLSFSVTQVLTYATHTAFLDGFFLALGNGSFQISAAFDGATWDPTQAVSRQAAYDPWIALAVVHQDIWLFGRETADIYYNAGTAPFPFQQRPGATVGAGCLAPYSIAAIDNTLLWLGASSAGGAIVYRANGLIPQRVSTHAIETAINAYTTVEDATGFSYVQNGHSFYVLTFPTADVTWVYDVATDLWHQRGFWDTTTDPTEAKWHAWRPAWTRAIAASIYAGDRLAGKMYRLSSSVLTDVDGTGVRRLRRFPHLSASRDRVFFNRLELLIDAGLGTVTGQGVNPQLMLQWSNDGGYTWGPEFWRSAGPLGQYSKRVFWAPCGSSRDRVFELVQSDPTPARWLAAYVEAGVARA